MNLANRVSDRRGRIGGACAVVLASGGVSQAQITRLIMEASVDDAQTWVSEVTPALGQVVYFRVRAQLLGATALGFASVTYQPTLTNWNAGVDEVVPFTFPGIQNDGLPGTETEYVGRAVGSLPATNTGRMWPLGTAGQSASSSSGLLTFHEDPGNVLRFAGSKNTTPTTNVAWGVVSVQNPPVFPEGFDSRLDLELFRYAVMFNAGNVGYHEASIGNLATGVVRWYLNTSGTSVISTMVETGSATVVPGPGAVGVVAVTGALAARRRRSNQTT